ncbi:MAG: DUF1926 domain-containing protein, partial [Spirochaetales bacterium]|nr:DUF1926 domain-containing protein [Spirochaetales bacterium]
YSTVLPLIPSSDRSGQIELLTTLLRRKFGKRPRGAWVTECVWEPGMPSSLKRSGMEYVFLDDSHFIGAGLRGDELYEPVITEDQGKAVLVFPISADMRLFPFRKDPAQVVDQIQSLSEDTGKRVITLIEDGECFGAWNGSGKTLYGEGWLVEFLESLRKLKGSVVSTRPGAWRIGEREYQKRYFPCTSYEEMMKWTLPVERRQEFDKLQRGKLSKNSRAYLRGGYFRQFLSKYTESNLLYAKMMHAHVLVNQIRGDKSLKKAAREELWRGEDHSAYWHGKRGGIYSNPIRKAAYCSLISAEKMSRQRGVFRSHISTEDFDMDGLTEYLYHGNELNMYVHRNGGMAFELDYLSRPWNYLDTFTRKREYFQEIIDGGQVADPYPRKAFLDHFMRKDEQISNFDRMTHSELGNFLTMPYDVKECRRDHMELVFAADGLVGKNGSRIPVSIEKRYRMKRNSIVVEYGITNRGTAPVEECFGSEINLSFASMDELQLSIQKKDSEKSIKSRLLNAGGTVGFSAADQKNKVLVQGNFAEETELWIVPVEAVWLEQNGRNRGYQSTCFLPRWSINLNPGELWKTSIALSFTKNK